MGDDRFQHSVVQDLAWVIGSPCLVASRSSADAYVVAAGAVVTDGECRAMAEQALPALRTLDRDPAPLEQFIQARLKTRRLGDYFECLIAYLLGEVLQVSDLHHGVQVHSGGKTLGEFDFIFRDPQSNKWVHWETSVKFFLGRRDQLFVGMKGSDRLDLKLQHAFEHQLTLGSTTAAQPTLATLGISQLQSRLFMKGMLFYPRFDSEVKVLDPPLASSSHLRGWWCTMEEWLASSAHAVSGDGRSTWKIIPKREWLSPSGFGVTAEELEAQLRDHFAASDQAVMVVEFAAAPLSKGGEPVELSRGCILQQVS